MTLSSRETTFVLPFYLELMRTNATWVGHEVWNDLVVVGRTAGLDDVLSLLRVGSWRQVVMGAWLSLRFDGDDVGLAVLDALRASAGSLTLPPLAVASVLIVGKDAAGALRESRARADEASVAVLDAALERVDSDPVNVVSLESRAGFADMLSFGARLRAALTSS